MSWNTSGILNYVEEQLADISGLTDPLTNPLNCGNQQLFNVGNISSNGNITCQQLNYTTLNPPIQSSYRPTNNYYVAPNGNDISGNGSILQPFQTIGKAIQFAGLYGAGVATEIFIYSGTYIENIITPIYNLSFTGYSGGTGGDNEVQPNQSVIIQGTINITGTASGSVNVPTTFNNIYFNNCNFTLSFATAGLPDFTIEFVNCSLLLNTISQAGFYFLGSVNQVYNVYFTNCDIRTTSGNNSAIVMVDTNLVLNNTQITVDGGVNAIIQATTPNVNNTVTIINSTIINTTLNPNPYAIIYFADGGGGSIINSTFKYTQTISAPNKVCILVQNGCVFDNMYNNNFFCPGSIIPDISGNGNAMVYLAGLSSSTIVNNCYNNYGVPGTSGYGAGGILTINTPEVNPLPGGAISDISSGNVGIIVTSNGSKRLISNNGVFDISGGNGITLSGSKTLYTINNNGVLDLSGSSGINISGSKTQYQINNLGVIDISAGNTGIIVSGTQNPKIISNNGVIDVSGGNGITLSGSKTLYTINNSGVLDLSAGSGISISGTKTSYQINNVGVTQLTAGSGISLSANTGNITVSTIQSPVEVDTVFVTTSGTYAVPAGYSSVEILAMGGGGGGGGRVVTSPPSFSMGAGGGGGSGASVRIPRFSVYTGTQFVVTIGSAGAGGTGNTTSSTPGGNGGTTTVSLNGYTLLTATGGFGGGAGSTFPLVSGAGGNGGDYGGGAGNALGSPTPIAGGTGTVANGQGFTVSGNTGGAGGWNTVPLGQDGGGGGPGGSVSGGFNSAQPGMGGAGAGTGTNGLPGGVGFVSFVFYK
jgi:hypothetical protein